MEQVGKAKVGASITARVIRADGRVEEYFWSHPWKPWQRWWWSKVLGRSVPTRGRIPKFRPW